MKEESRHLGLLGIRNSWKLEFIVANAWIRTERWMLGFVSMELQSRREVNTVTIQIHGHSAENVEA
jgi:hypothetical protein